MSGKIVRRSGLLLATWLDVDRQNRWVLVDPSKGAVVREGTVGPVRKDNHCGAAVTTDVDGTLHLVVGAHHGPFVHYRMPSGADDWQAVEDGRAIGQAATYPSLVCDGQGTLHLTYRHEPGGRNACLHYHRRPKEGSWSEARVLAKSAVSEHSWLTNAIEVGPKGRLHVVLSNTLPVPDAGPTARYYGASHLYSDDSGHSWRQFGLAEPLALPAAGATLRRVESDTLDPRRVEAEYGGPRGPLNSYYHKILLSNVAVDQQGRPWVVVHNLLEGTARRSCTREASTPAGTATTETAWKPKYGCRCPESMTQSANGRAAKVCHCPAQLQASPTLASPHCLAESRSIWRVRKQCLASTTPLSSAAKQWHTTLSRTV
jgi:hypothetical protein